MAHENAPESPVAASGPESGHMGDRDAQDAREARYAKAIQDDLRAVGEQLWRGDPTETVASIERTLHVRALADSELAPLHARVSELEARLDAVRLTRDYFGEQAAENGVRAERAEAALARVEALAKWFEAQPNWIGWGVHVQIRAAVAAAGPAVSDGEGE